MVAIAGKKHSRSWKSLLSGAALCCGLGLLQPQAVLSAEEIVFRVVGPIELDISLAELEAFADGGEPEGNLALLINRLDDRAVEQLRVGLKQPLEIDVVTLSRASYTPLLEAIYKRLGRLIQGNLGRRNHWRGIRGALIVAAAHPDGVTLLNVMRQYPLKTIRVDTGTILELVDELDTLVSYRDAATAAIARQAEREIANNPTTDFATLPDPRQAGTFAVAEQVLPLRIRAIRQTRLGLADSYTFNTDLYLPQGLEGPAPLVVISHGFGDSPRTFAAYGRHLASHGYIVAIPEHIGSDAAYREGLLRGQLTNTTSPIEYINRPLDVTYLLDELERLVQTDPGWQNRIDFSQVAAMGHSFGGYTALALAGAPLNQQRLQLCSDDELTLNVSLLLQCRAQHLPPLARNLTDPRIKATIAVNPITSRVLGPESVSQIEIPTLLVTGTDDLIAPAIQEQIHPFVWLEAPEKYLAAIVPGTHTSAIEDPNNRDRGAIALIAGPRPDLGRAYIKGLSLAFLEVHLRQNEAYRPHLSAAYAREIGNPELDLYLVRSLGSGQLAAAFGKAPPVPVRPEPLIAEVPQPADESILAEIEREGLLKIAMREDAPPFGYIDAGGVWTGYCLEFADRLADFLTERLDRPEGIDVVRLPSTLTDRFDLVGGRQVHLECGPNSIQAGEQGGTAFSGAFFASGVQLLVSARQRGELTPANGFAGVRTGVLRDSTTARFLARAYPRADTVVFTGPAGRAEGIQALIDGEIDAFASDGVLLVGELTRQQLQTEGFTLVPERPLTCEFYGHIVPANDPEWDRAIRDFLREDDLQLSKKWTESLSFDLIEELDRCFNRLP